MLLCFACLGAARAEVVTIGSGNSSNQYLPTYSTYNYSLTQQIYTASEIGRAGVISSIAFKNTGSDMTRTLEIYLVHTNKTYFSSTTDWITVGGNDRVFFGGVTFTSGEWTTILFDKPFEYDGTSNLAVIVDDETGEWENGMTCAAFTATGMGLRVYGDYTDFSPYSPPTSYTSDEYAAISNEKNQIKLDFPTCLPPTHVRIQEGSLVYNGVTMAWDVEEGVSIQQFMYPTVDFVLEEIEYMWSYPWEGNHATWDVLDPDTDYTFGIRSYCGEDDQSAPVLFTFHTPAACEPPTNFHLSTLTHNLVFLEWEPNGDFDVEFKLSSASEWTPIAQHCGPGCGFGSVEGIAPGNTYNARVMQHCSNGYDSDWAETSFTTPPVPMTVPFSEGFATTSIPTNWSRYQGLLSEVMAGTTALTATSSYWSFGTYNGAFSDNYHAYSNIYGTARYHWLVTPGITLENNCVLSFDVAYTAYNGTLQAPQTNGNDDKFVVLVSTNYGISWQILRQWDNAGSQDVLNELTPGGKTVTIDLNAYSGQTVQVAFYCESTINNADNHLHIDNVNIDFAPPCWDLKTTVTLSDITSHSAIVHWELTGETTDWAIDYCEDPNFNDLVFSSAVSGSTSSITINELTPATQYFVRVAPLCRTTTPITYTPWSEVASFTTPCEAVTTFPWSEDFESYNSGYFADPCWKNEHIAGNGTNMFRVYTFANDSNSTHQLQLPDMEAGNMTKLVLPEITLPNNLYRFALDVYRSSSTYNDLYPNEGIRVFASTDGEIEGATELAFIPRQYHVGNDVIPAEDETGWYTYYLPIGISGRCYIILRGESQYCTATYMDNFVVEEIPPCWGAPSNLTITEVTPHGVEATFTPGGFWQTAWYFNYTTTAEPPTYANGMATIPSIIYSEESHVFQSNTHYYLWAGIECEEGGTTTFVWGEPAEFTTPYACQTKLYAQEVDIDDVQAHEISLDWGNSPATANQWQVYYAYYDMVPANEAYINEVAVTTDEPYVTIDGLSSDLDYYFWIRALCDVWEGTPEWGEWSDMITVHTSVSCFPPTNLVASTTANSATITWTPGQSENHWTVEITTEDWGDYPWSYDVDEPSITFDEETLNGLVDDGDCYDKNYTVYVYSECGQVDGSSIAAELEFTVTDKRYLTVNDSTVINGYVPVYGTWVDKYSRSQFIIPEEDLEDMKYGEISGLTFYCSNPNINWGAAQFEVRLAMVPNAEFETATLNDWSKMKLVYTGELAIVDRQMVIDFDTKFLYEGGNLMVGVNQIVSGTYRACSWYGVSTENNVAVGGYEESKGISLQKFLPKTTFTYVPGETPACPRPYGFAVETTTGTQGIFSWIPASEDQTAWQIVIANDNTLNLDPDDFWGTIIEVNENPYVYNGLTPERLHQAAIRTVCDCDGEACYSDWSDVITFTTPVACPDITDVTVTDITSYSATVNWMDYGRTWITFYKAGYYDTFIKSGFEDGSLGEWTSEGDGEWKVGTGDYIESLGAHSGMYNAQILHNTKNNETYLVSPMMDLSGQTDVNLSFWYTNRKWTNDIDSLYVYYRINGGEWNRLFYTDENHEEWTHVDINLPNPAANYQIGFKMTDYYGYGVGLDDIMVYYGDWHPLEWVNSFWTSDLQVTFGGLESNTEYLFQMISNCDGVDSPNWTEQIHFTTLPDNCKVFVTEGEWGEPSNWRPYGVPTINMSAILRANATITSGTVATANSIIMEGSPKSTLTIDEGGQLMANCNVRATIKKSITGYGADNVNTAHGYYLISVPSIYYESPYNLNITTQVDGQDTYDLYKWNRTAVDEEWQNYKKYGYFSLDTVAGYLYANQNDIEINLTSTLRRSDKAVVVELPYDTLYPCWNLYGNPFPCNVRIDERTPYYKMNATGDGIELVSGFTPIAPMEGFFLTSDAENQHRTIVRDMTGSKGSLLNIALNHNGDQMDNILLIFEENEVEGVRKLVFNGSSSRISLPCKGEDYGALYAQKSGEVW